MPSNEQQTPRGFITVTRVYSQLNVTTQESEIKKQPFDIAVTSIESYRPRSKIAGQKSSIVSTSGKYVNVAESKNDIRRKIIAALAA